MRLPTSIRTYIIPLHSPHTFIRDLTIITGITITSFITTTPSSQVIAVGSMFRKVHLAQDLS
jgi:hypothetical protein